jgi:hypothetical protein
MQPPQIYISSASVYNPPIDSGTDFSRRWGDYSYTSLDPDDDMTFWTIQEFAYTIDTSGSTPVYGLRIAKLAAPPPTTPVSASPTLPPGQASVSLTITGSSVDGSGFYEPGPGFARHLKVLIDGEITVNSISEVTPTSISLDVSTLFAIPGQHSVTITNPDGQTITGTGIVNVADYSCTQAVDNGAPDGSEGSLRRVLESLTDGDCMTLIFNNLSPISLDSSMTVPAGVTITTDQPCASGKVEIINTNGTSDGLILNGGSFFGLYVHGFNGRQIVANSGSNHLKCITAAGT